MFRGVDESITCPSYVDKESPIEKYAEFGANNKSGDQNGSKFCLLELAAENDLDEFKRCVEEDNCKIDMVGVWYTRRNGSRQLVLEQRTPAMIAALYGSLDVLRYIMNYYRTHGGDVDQACGGDSSTALHCAVAGGSDFAMESVWILLTSGANVNVLDAFGRSPTDVVYVPQRFSQIGVELEVMLENYKSNKQMSFGLSDLPFPLAADYTECSRSASSMASSISFPRSGFSSSPPSSHLSTLDSKFLCYTTEKAHDNAVEPSPPDVRNTIFTTDEFRMYSFKVRPCSRTYSHDWTECPFVHPGENARRRDPRRYHYSCVPCPEFRKGTCRKGDSCEHAHGVFECWLHPAQYRTRICKGGTSCNRRVCFFAHTTEELRPLYISSSYRISPPRSSSSTETSVMSPPRTLASPFSISPSRSCTTNVTAHTSPSSAVPCTLHGPWKNTSMPSLRLPAPILHSSSFPAAFKAHDASMVGSPTWKDQKHVHHTYDPSSKERMSTLSKLDAVICAPSKNIHARVSAQKYRDLGVSLGPSNLEEILSVESSSSSQYVKHKNPLILPESPTGVNRPYSNIILQMQLLESQLSLSEYHLSAPTRASSLNNNNLSQMPLLNGWDAEWQENGDPSTRSMAAASPVAASSPQDKSNSFHNPGSSLKWSEWGSITGEPKWSVQPDYLSKLRKSFSIAKDGNNIEPAWMQKSKDMPVDMGLRIDDECYRQRETNATMSHLELWIDKLKVGQIGS